MADIDLSSYTGTEFNIIGYYRTAQDNKPFRGVFDGNGRTISKFTYIAPGKGGAAIFETISPKANGEGGEVRDLGLIDPNVHAPAGLAIGTLASYLEQGTIRNCYVRGGRVTGSSYVGGLVGISAWGHIVNCYTSSQVSGGDYVGGLVADNYGSAELALGDASIVTNCYSTSGVSGNDHVGGLMGSNLGIVYNSFWDVETSGQSTSAGGAGRTTAEMQRANTFLGWGARSNEGIWMIDEGNNYPRLRWENQAGQPIEPNQLSDLLAGTGTEGDPLLIYTAEELNTVGLFPCDWDKHFKVIADIDLAGYTGAEFNMIGSQNPRCDWPPFTGVLDGGNHTIANFSYHSMGSAGLYPTGLFARVNDPNAEIRNLRLADPNVGARLRHYVGSLIGSFRSGNLINCHAEGGKVVGHVAPVGGLVGFTGGTIARCSSTVTVEGRGAAGGLAGSNEGRIITSYSSGAVGGYSDTGGLVGSNNGILADCYATGGVLGERDVGGLVGGHYPDGAITNCYSAGNVSGNENVGGLVGYSIGWWVSACFWDTETSGRSSSRHGTGKTTAEMQTASTFLDAGWDFVGETANGIEDIWWILEGQGYPKLSWEAK